MRNALASIDDYDTEDPAARLKASAEDLFFALDAIVDAIHTDGVAREAYRRELQQAQAILLRAMGATD